jgi:hypothetical protein
LDSLVSIDLEALFSKLNPCYYVIIRGSDKLQHRLITGSDIDIFTIEKHKLLHAISNYIINKYPNLTIEVVNLVGQVHLDVIDKQKLLLRFDIYTEIPKFKKIILMSSLFEWIISRCHYTKFGSSEIPIPNPVDNCLMRIIELNEYYFDRPDKIKHLHYIENNFDRSQLEEALDLLYYFTKFPKVENIKPTFVKKSLASISKIVDLNKKLYKSFRKRNLK